MVKNLRFLLLSMVAMLAGTTMAQTEFDFDTNGTTLLGLPGESGGSGASAVTDGDITEAKTATIGDYSVTVSAGVPNDKGTVATPNRLWNKAPKLRLYSGTLTITSSGANFKSIVFTSAASASQAKWGANNSASVGTIDATDKKNIVWSGDAKEVVFTITANTQISTIVISTEAVVPTPTPDPDPQPGVETEGKGTLESPFTAADAIKVATALGEGNTSTADYYVKGKISSIKNEFDVEHGTAIFFISDNGEAENEFQVYSVYYLENKSWQEGNTQIKVGDEVIIFGKLTNYKGTPETASKKAYIYSLNGVTKNEGGEEPQPQPEIETITVAKALEIGAALEAGKTTTVEYIVNGFVVAEPTWTPYTDKTTGEVKNYNLDFQMNDAAGATDNALLVYHAWNLENTYFPTIDENLAVGTEVSLQGKIQNYVKDEVSTIELTKAHFLKIGEKVNAINTVKADNRFEGAIYNLAGQRVMKAQKGLYIMNGKKYLVK